MKSTHYCLAKYTTLFMVFFMVLFTSQAQVDFTFSTSAATFCAPVPINFTASGVTGFTSLTWDFDDGGANAIGDPNPNRNFVNPGVYVVELTAVVNGQTSVVTETVTVYANPMAGFSTTGASGCSPLAVSFTDTSILGDAAIVGWYWDFGDGNANSLNLNSVGHSYLTGQYDVTLIVTDGNGCESNVTIPDYILAEDQPIASFGGPYHACDTPAALVMINNSIGSSQAQYTWAIGSGDSAFTENPVINVGNFGSFSVALTVTEPGGCSHVSLISNYANVVEVIANFGLNNDTSCIYNTTSFAQLSAGSNLYYWDYGDGSLDTTSVSNAYNYYSASGDYDVQLIATYDGGCPDTATLVQHIELVQADFTSSPSYICELPMNVAYTDNSINAVSWEWILGSGDSTNAQNPVVTYTTGGVPSNGYADSPVYDMLIVTSSHGCVDTSVLNNVNIYLFEPAFTMDVSKGCTPVVVNFTDASQHTDSIVSWFWDFGDGNTSTLQNPTNSFVDHGDYNVTLTITNAAGCDTFIVDLVEVGLVPTVMFSLDPDTTCAIDEVNFYDLSFVDTNGVAAAGEDYSLVDEWLWSGISSAFTFGSTEQNPTHMEFDTTGFMDVMLIVGYNGCYDTLIGPDSLFVWGAITDDVTEVRDCSDPFVRSFTATFIDTTSFIWDFGDGDVLSYYGLDSLPIPVGTHGGRTSGTFDNPTHVYQATGDYTVVLTGYWASALAFSSDSCEYADSIIVQIRDVEANFTISDTTVCVGDTVLFDAGGSIDGSGTLDEMTYYWTCGDGTFVSLGYYADPIGGSSSALYVGQTGAPGHWFQDTGVYSMVLDVRDQYGCIGSDTQNVYVYHPYADFGNPTPALYACAPFDLAVADSSTSVANLVAWEWFDNGISASSAQDTILTLVTPGDHEVTLLITDEHGCQSQASFDYYAIKPTANFYVPDSTLCVDEATSLFDLSVPDTFTHDSLGNSYTFNVTAWDWGFGDSGTDNNQNTTHAYTDSGTYDIILVVTDIEGCQDTLIHPAYIDVQEFAIVNFDANPLTADCYPTPVNFSIITDMTLNDPLLNLWSFGNGGANIGSSAPTTTYTLPGSYDVTLQLTTTYGCVSDTTFEDFIVITGPYADFDIDDTIVCIGELVSMDVFDNNGFAFDFNWDFGDGNGSSAATSVSHVYDQAGTYIVNVIYYDNQGGCQQSVSHTVIVVDVGADFYRNSNPDIAEVNWKGCEPFEVNFIDVSAADAYSWDFDDGNVSTDYEPTNIFTSPGTFHVTLTITDNAAGCTSEMSKEIEVYPRPPVTVVSDGTVCEGFTYNLAAASTASPVAFSWTPTSTLSDSLIANPVASPVDTTIYSVVATDNNGCTSLETVTVDVILEPEVTIGFWSEDSVTLTSAYELVIGEYVDIEATVSEGYTYTWAPPTDLSCVECLDPTFDGIQPYNTYTFIVADVQELCAPAEFVITITVVENYAWDVPMAFSPNGDGKNDVIYVEGWGINKLLTFEIFNRWGEKVFENVNEDFDDQDLNGWDGNYKGKPQSADTYLVVVQVEYFDGTVAGNFIEDLTKEEIKALTDDQKEAKLKRHYITLVR